MKIAVISDMHLGYAIDTELENDSYDNALQAINIALKQEPDLFLFPGDIFHNKIPKPEVLAKAIELFSYLKSRIKSKSKIIELKSSTRAPTSELNIPSIISIYGTHEKRNPDNINPIQLLEKANLLYNLHAESALIKVEGEKGTSNIGIHGLSGVPDQYAREHLTSWNPAPFPGVPNLLMIHQTFKDLIPAITEDILELSELPEGFDYFLLGHIHWNQELKHPKYNIPILLPGSTVLTQMNKVESKIKKGLYIIDITKESKKATFIPINTRSLIYHSFEFENKRPSELIIEISDLIESYLKNITEDQKKVLLKIKLKGKLAPGFLPTDLNLRNIIKKYSNKMIINIDKKDVVSDEVTEGAKILTELKQKQLSVDQLGLSILKEIIKPNIQETQLQKIDNLFEHLSAGNLEKAEQTLALGDNLKND